MRPLACLLAAALGAVPAWATRAWATDVEVRVQTVASAAGSVRVQLCREAEWLKDCPIAAHGPATAGVSVVVVPDVPPGTYGVIAFHDSNDDGDVNQNLLGLPTEGVGFSRDAQIRLGPPRFGDAALQVAGPRVVVGITLHFER